MGSAKQKTGKDIQDTLASIARMKLSVDEVIPILREWESRPTLTAKKVFAATAFLMAVAAFIGIDYGQLPFMGISEGRGTPRATLVPFIVLLSSGVVYWWQRGIDLNLRRWQSKGIEERIRDLGDQLDSVRPLLTEVEEADFRKLPYLDATKTRHRVRYSSDALNAFYFYHEEFKPQQNSRRAFEILEVVSLFGLGVYGYWGLLAFWRLG